MALTQNFEAEIEKLEAKYLSFNRLLFLENLLENNVKYNCVYTVGSSVEFRNALLPLYKLGVWKFLLFKVTKLFYNNKIIWNQSFNDFYGGGFHNQSSTEWFQRTLPHYHTTCPTQILASYWFMRLNHLMIFLYEQVLASMGYADFNFGTVCHLSVHLASLCVLNLPCLIPATLHAQSKALQ